jgi:hypothetical protein
VNTLATLLTLLLGGGGLGGLAVLLRLRTDKGATVVDTVSKGVLVLERLNDRLETDLAEERSRRVAAETALSEHMRHCHDGEPSTHDTPEASP